MKSLPFLRKPPRLLGLSTLLFFTFLLSCDGRSPCPSVLTGNSCAYLVKSFGYAEEDIEESLAPYYNDYLDAREAHGLSRKPKNTALTLKYKELDSSNLGVCYRKPVRSLEGGEVFQLPEVYINLNVQSEARLRYVVFHELGHCLHEYDHETPARIMRAKLGSTAFTRESWNEMVDEYFAPY